MEGPRATPLYAAALRPQTWLGADRSILIGIFTLTAVLVMVALIAPMLWLTVPALLFMVGSVKLVRSAFEKDPIFFKVYLRAIKYVDYYPAKSGLYAKVSQRQKSWI